MTEKGKQCERKRDAGQSSAGEKRGERRWKRRRKIEEEALGGKNKKI